MASSTRITRSKGESDGLSLPMKSRSTRRDATSERNGGTTSTAGWEHQQQMPTQMPHTTQSPETASAKRTATAPMLPPGPHRPLTPRMPLPTSPTSEFIHTPVPGGRIQLYIGRGIRSDIYTRQVQWYLSEPERQKDFYTNTF